MRRLAVVRAGRHFTQVINKLRDRIPTLRVGNPLDKNTDIGAINSRTQLEKIRELVDSGVEEGAELTQRRSVGVPAKGYWFRRVFSRASPRRIASRRRKFSDRC